MLPTFFKNCQSIQWLDYGLNDRALIPRRNEIFFSSPPRPDRDWGPPSLLASGYQGIITSGVERPEREDVSSPPSSAEVKSAWSYNSTLPYVFMAWC
jgi:hypothetical protein